MNPKDSTEPKLNFNDHDKLERKKFAERLEKVIFSLTPLYHESFVLSLNAKFGCGKTTFLKMWENRLISEDIDSDCSVIKINAWESDFDEEPLVHILDALLEQIENDNDKEERIKKSLQFIMGASSSAVDQASKSLTGVSVKEALDTGTKEATKEKALQNFGEQLYQQYAFKKKAYKELNQTLNDYVEHTDQKIFIFVDELDRVRPSYAVRFLETIKHFFNIHGICFIIAVDKEQLKKSVKQLYGDIDFQNYYLRFITREVDLPEAKKIDLTPYIEKMGEHYLNEKINGGITFPINQKALPQLISFIAIMAKSLSIEARQVQYFFRIFTQFLVCQNNGKILPDCQIRCSILLIGVFVKDQNLYNKLGAPNTYALDGSTLQDTLEFLAPLKTSVVNNSYADDLFLSFLAFLYNPNVNIGKYMLAGRNHLKEDSSWINVTDNNINNTLRARLSRIAGFPNFNALEKHQKSQFEELYEVIEEWRPFIT